MVIRLHCLAKDAAKFTSAARQSADGPKECSPTVNRPPFSRPLNRRVDTKNSWKIRRYETQTGEQKTFDRRVFNGICQHYQLLIYQNPYKLHRYRKQHVILRLKHTRLSLQRGKQSNGDKRTGKTWPNSPVERPKTKALVSSGTSSSQCFLCLPEEDRGRDKNWQSGRTPERRPLFDPPAAPLQNPSPCFMGEAAQNRLERLRRPVGGRNWNVFGCFL